MGGGNGNSNSNRDPVKVVIINTQYVETDAVSFKSVVQNLTGKESTVGPGQKRLKSRSSEVSGCKSGPAGLNRGMSFKDFDRMLMELPPLDELYRIYSDS